MIERSVAKPVRRFRGAGVAGLESASSLRRFSDTPSFFAAST